MKGRYNVRTLHLDPISEAFSEFRRIGVDEADIFSMASKAFGEAIKLEKVSCRAATTIKRELLALGGDVAVSRKAITGKVETSDVILIGNRKQLDQLAARIAGQPHGLEAIARELNALLRIMAEPPRFLLDCRGHRFDLSSRTHIMGVLNVTSNSFSDGGKYFDIGDAIHRAEEMVAEGADIIDVGGESTRPGAMPISLAEETARVVPVVEKLVKDSDVPISVDTYKSEMARRALEAGAHLINDISGLRFDPEMAGVAAEYGVPVVLMHIKGTPRNMQINPTYEDLISEITDYLRDGIELATEAGIEREKVLVDPGIGFGKTVEHNLEIIRRLRELASLGQPILIGPSRKSFIGKVLDLPVEDRLEGTAAAVAVSIINGANIIRAHDVKQMVRVARMVDAICRWP